MARILLFLFLLVVFFTAGYRGAIELRQNRFFAKVEKGLHSEPSFQPTLFPAENLPFAIAIVGRNNGAWLEKTLQSAFFQNYPNYRIVYVDDCSDDGSFELAKDLIAASEHHAKTALYRNETPEGFLPSLARAVSECKEREIVVVLHGEDRLAHEWVLQRLNQYYANPDLWMTYGQYVYASSYQFGFCRAFQGEDPRRSPFFASHLKTFYAKLFKFIEESDLFFKGQGIGAEMTLMIPLLEIAKEHIGYVPDVLYVATKQSESREQLSRIESHLRSLNSHFPLRSLFSEVP